MTTDILEQAGPAIGAALPRVDGPDKVSGLAPYTADVHLPGMLYAVPVCSTIACGEIAAIDACAALALPGVRAVYQRANLGQPFRALPDEPGMPKLDERRPPLADDRIRYYGQYAALAVADTLEQAQAAAAAVQVSYREQPPQVAGPLQADGRPAIDSERGDPDAAYASAPVRLDETYATPVHAHNPMELHASLAHWQDGGLTLYESSQAVVNHRDALAKMLDMPPERVRVVCRYMGGGFGGKLWPWPHSLLAAAAARVLQRPVKLVLSRPMMFRAAGHRPATRQRVRLGATTGGRLLSLRHDAVNHTSMLDDYKENCGEATAYLYAVDNLRVTSALCRRTVGAPTSMRGPGAVPGLYATESALNELAWRLGMDPLELRLRNEPAEDPSRGRPFSSRHLTECMREGARRFGWQDRDPRVGAMRRGDLALGWGMASAAWLALRFAARARVALHDDGTATVSCATQDLGTGTYTVLAQIAADCTGLPPARVKVELGDTDLPAGPVSGGSAATASLIPAVAEASRQAVAALVALAAGDPASPLAGCPPQALRYSHGRVADPAGDAAGVPMQDILRAAGRPCVQGEGSGQASARDPAMRRCTVRSFGAHFAEVSWHAPTASLRVSRIVTVIDAGRILNPRLGRNQIEGALMMGVGMALLEETVYDPRCGAPVTDNLADYLLPTHADAPELDVSFLEHPDPVLNELGARGIGEIGLAGIAAAIADAVHHATGVRVRELPVRIEDLLGAAAPETPAAASR